MLHTDATHTLNGGDEMDRSPSPLEHKGPTDLIALDRDAARPTVEEEQNSLPETSTIAAAAQTILEHIGEDVHRDGLLRTPERYAQAMRFLTRGYSLSLEAATNGAIFENNHHEMVVVQDLDVFSLCEHHMLPFMGKVHIAYLPQGRVLGLSKMGRIVEIFARRFTLQECLTRNVADAIQQVLQPAGVAVVMRCSHTCMSMRGVQQTNSTTVTESKTGVFCQDPRLEQKFLGLLRVN